MSTQYSSYSVASEAAKEHSIKNPGIGWFVNWVENDAWEISIFSDYESQEFWLNGHKIIPDELDWY